MMIVYASLVQLCVHKILMQRCARMIMTTIGMLEMAGRLCAGLAIGIALLDLTWKVQGVMLAGSAEYYAVQQSNLVKAFSSEILTGEQLRIRRDMACPWQLSAPAY